VMGGFLFVQMVLRTWNEYEDINDTSLPFELFCRIGRSRPLESPVWLNPIYSLK